MREWFDRRSTFWWAALMGLGTASNKALGSISVLVGGSIGTYAAFVSHRTWLVFVCGVFVVAVLMEAAYGKWTEEEARADDAERSRAEVVQALEDRDTKRSEAELTGKAWAQGFAELLTARNAGTEIAERVRLSQNALLLGSEDLSHETLSVRTEEWGQHVCRVLKTCPPGVEGPFHNAVRVLPEVEFPSLIKPESDAVRLARRLAVWREALQRAIDVLPEHITEHERYRRTI